MSKLLGVLALITAIGVVAVIGCGPRLKVAANAVVAKIDAALGELNVKRQEIEDSRESIRDQMKGVSEGLYRAKARQKVLDGKIVAEEANKARIKDKINRLIELVDEASSSDEKFVTVGAKQVTAEELTRSAKSVKRLYDNAKITLEGYQSSAAILKDSVAFLSKQKETATAVMSELDAKIEQIDVKRESYMSARQDAVLNAENKSLTDELAKLQKDVEDISIEVDVKWEMEKDKMEEIGSADNELDILTSSSEGSFGEAESILNNIFVDDE